ncbi:uncharacterized protein LOC131848628 [Achroia grisella]|uniref:uncharacterized protein LOC131848628 n=1 Tax=Achroia grisella TaxID=688607 RepID=UPI0027D2EA49|nr:uncharacterized protein LOC131848628 [Achroia grisella]
MATMIKEKRREKKKAKEKSSISQVLEIEDPPIPTRSSLELNADIMTADAASEQQTITTPAVETYSTKSSHEHVKDTTITSHSVENTTESNNQKEVVKTEQLEVQHLKPLRDEHAGKTFEDLNLKLERMSIPAPSAVQTLEVEQTLVLPNEYVSNDSTMEIKSQIIEDDIVVPSAPTFEIEEVPQATYTHPVLVKEVPAPLIEYKVQCMPLEQAVWIYGGKEIAEVKSLSEREEAAVETGPVSGPEHPLVDLLSTLRQSYTALERDRTQLFNGFAEEEKYRSTLWKIEKKTLHLSEQCKCGASVDFWGSYEDAQLLKDRIPAARMRLTALLRDIQESYCHHQYSALLAFCQIEEFLSGIIKTNKNEIREALTLILQALKLSDNAPPALAKVLQRWATALSVALVDGRDLRQLLFLIHHLFRQTRSVRWAAPAVSAGAGAASGPELLALLELLLTRPPALEHAAECTEEGAGGSAAEADAWEEVGRGGAGGAVSEGALRERDLLALLRAAPLRRLVGTIMLFPDIDVRRMRAEDWRAGGSGALRAARGVRALLAALHRARVAHPNYTRLHRALRTLSARALRALAALHLHARYLARPHYTHTTHYTRLHRALRTLSARALRALAALHLHARYLARPHYTHTTHYTRLHRALRTLSARALRALAALHLHARYLARPHYTHTTHYTRLHRALRTLAALHLHARYLARPHYTHTTHYTRLHRALRTLAARALRALAALHLHARYLARPHYTHTTHYTRLHRALRTLSARALRALAALHLHARYLARPHYTHTTHYTRLHRALRTLSARALRALAALHLHARYLARPHYTHTTHYTRLHRALRTLAALHLHARYLARPHYTHTTHSTRLHRAAHGCTARALRALAALHLHARYLARPHYTHTTHYTRLHRALRTLSARALRALAALHLHARYLARPHYTHTTHYTRLHRALRTLSARALRALAALHLHASTSYERALRDEITAEMEACYMAGVKLFGTSQLQRLPATLLADNSASDYYYTLIIGLHDKDQNQLEVLPITVPLLSCKQRVEVVSQATIDRRHDHQLARVVVEFLLQACVKRKPAACGGAGGCEHAARAWLPRVLHAHPYLYTIALHLLADIYQMSPLEACCVQYLRVQAWRPTFGDARAVLDDWARRCPPLLAPLLLNLDYTPHSGVSLEVQLTIGSWVCARGRSWAGGGAGEALWRILRRLRVHRACWALPLLAPDPDPEPDPDDHFANAYALLSSSWGHCIPLICSRGAEALARLAGAGAARTADAVHCLAAVLLALSPSPESVSRAHAFTEVFNTLLNSGPKLVLRALGLGGASGAQLLMKLMLAQLADGQCGEYPCGAVLACWLRAAWRPRLAASGAALVDAALLAARDWPAADAHAALLLQGLAAADAHAALLLRSHTSIAPSDRSPPGTGPPQTRTPRCCCRSIPHTSIAPSDRSPPSRRRRARRAAAAGDSRTYCIKTARRQELAAAETHAALLLRVGSRTLECNREQLTAWCRAVSSAPLATECLLRAAHAHELRAHLPRLLDALHRQRAAARRTHVDHALQEINANVAADELVVYRACAAALSSPPQHPAHLMLWRLFMHIYLQRPSCSPNEATAPIGPLFFSGIVKSRMLSNVRKRLQEVITYHQNEAKSLSATCTTPNSEAEAKTLTISKSNETKRVKSSNAIDSDLPPGLTATDFTGEASDESDTDSDEEDLEEDEKTDTDEVQQAVSETVEEDKTNLINYHVCAEKMVREYSRWLDEGSQTHAMPHHADLARYMPEQALSAAWQARLRGLRAAAGPGAGAGAAGDGQFPLPPPPRPGVARRPPVYTPQPTVFETAVANLLEIKEYSEKSRSRGPTLKSPVGDLTYTDARSLLAYIDKYVNDIEQFAREWCSEVDRITSLDGRLLELVVQLRVPRSLPPQRKACPQNCKPIVLVPDVQEWCRSTGAENSIRENRTSARAAVRRLMRPARVAVRAAVALLTLAREIRSAETARRAAERAAAADRATPALHACTPARDALIAHVQHLAQVHCFMIHARAARLHARTGRAHSARAAPRTGSTPALHACTPARDALIAHVQHLAQKWLSGDGETVVALVSRWAGGGALQAALVGALLQPRRLPPAQRARVYVALLHAALPDHVAFSHLSKFEMSQWSSEAPAEARRGVLEALLAATTRWGAAVDQQHHMLLELVGVHSSAVVTADEACWYVVAAASEGARGRLPPPHYHHLQRALARLAHHLTADQLGNVARELGGMWWEVRSRAPAAATSQHTQHAAQQAAGLAALLRDILRAFVAAARTASYTPERVGTYAWSAAREAWSPWLQPAAGVAALLPALLHHADHDADHTTDHYGDMLTSFVSMLRVLCDDFPDMERHLLGQVWEWSIQTYVSVQGAPAAQECRLQMSALLSALSRLPWQRHQWVTGQHVHAALQVCRSPDREITAWCSATFSGIEADTWLGDVTGGDVTSPSAGVDLARRLAALLSLFTAAPMPYTAQQLEAACRLPWWYLPETTLDEALDNYFIEHYDTNLPYHEIPQFSVLRSACALRGADVWAAGGLRAAAWSRRARCVSRWQSAASSQQLVAHVPAHCAAMLQILDDLAPFVEESSGELEDLFSRAVVIMCVESAATVALPAWVRWVRECGPGTRALRAAAAAVAALTPPAYCAALADATARTMLARHECGGWEEVRARWQRCTWAAEAAAAHAHLHAAYGLAHALTHRDRARSFLALLALNIDFLENEVIIALWICYACRAVWQSVDEAGVEAAEGSAGGGGGGDGGAGGDSVAEAEDCRRAAGTLLSRWAEPPRRTLLRLVTLQSSTDSPTAEHRVLCLLALYILSPGESTARSYNAALSALPAGRAGGAAGAGGAGAAPDAPRRSRLPHLAALLYPRSRTYFDLELQLAVDD